MYRFRWLDRHTRQPAEIQQNRMNPTGCVTAQAGCWFYCCSAYRIGPRPRCARSAAAMGDAFTTDSMFAKPSWTDASCPLCAAKAPVLGDRDQTPGSLDACGSRRLESPDRCCFGSNDQLVENLSWSGLRATIQPPRTLPCDRNVFVILMESLRANLHCALGSSLQINPSSTNSQAGCCSPSTSPVAPITIRACSPPWRASNLPRSQYLMQEAGGGNPFSRLA